jgi:hypothetical protein
VKQYVRWGIAVVALACALGAFGWLRSRGSQVQCTISNETQQIANVRVSIYDEQFNVENLSPGDSHSFSFRSHGDAHYALRVSFSSGEAYEDQLGYVTNGFDLDQTIRIREDRAEFESKPR